MSGRRTTYAQATLDYDEAHERTLVEAISLAIFEASKVSDCNAIVVRTGEAARALLTVLSSVLAMSPCATRSPTAIRRIADDLGKRLRRWVAEAERDADIQGFRPTILPEHRRWGQRVMDIRAATPQVIEAAASPRPTRNTPRLSWPESWPRGRSTSPGRSRRRRSPLRCSATAWRC